MAATALTLFLVYELDKKCNQKLIQPIKTQQNTMGEKRNNYFRLC